MENKKITPLFIILCMAIFPERILTMDQTERDQSIEGSQSVITFNNQQTIKVEVKLELPSDLYQNLYQNRQNSSSVKLAYPTLLAPGIFALGIICALPLFKFLSNH